MSTIYLHQTTTLTAKQYIAGLTDFGPGRSKPFGNSALQRQHFAAGWGTHLPRHAVWDRKYHQELHRRSDPEAGGGGCAGYP
jgi:hypothetical protein